MSRLRLGFDLLRAFQASLEITRIVCIGTYSILCDFGAYTSFYAYTRMQSEKVEIAVIIHPIFQLTFVSVKEAAQNLSSLWTLVLTVIGVFWRISSWITLRCKPSLSIFSLCSFRSWWMSFNPSSPERVSHSLFPFFSFWESINIFTSASCVEERVGIVGNGYTLGPQFCPSSLRPNLRLTGPRIHGWTGLARGNTTSDFCAELSSNQPRLLMGREGHHSERGTPSRALYGIDKLDCSYC